MNIGLNVGVNVVFIEKIVENVVFIEKIVENVWWFLQLRSLSSLLYNLVYKIAF